MTSRWITLAGFAVIGAALIATHVHARRNPGSRIPPFGALCGFVMRDRWGRLGLLLGWWWLGWHFLARS